MRAKYKYEIICPNLRGATNVLCATAKEIIYMSRQARMFKRNGFFIRYIVEINRCKELFDIYRQIKKQWSKMEY